MSRHHKIYIPDSASNWESISEKVSAYPPIQFERQADLDCLFDGGRGLLRISSGSRAAAATAATTMAATAAAMAAATAAAKAAATATTAVATASASTAAATAAATTSVRTRSASRATAMAATGSCACRPSSSAYNHIQFDHQADLVGHSRRLFV